MLFSGCYDRKEGRPGRWARDDAPACCKTGTCTVCSNCLIHIGPLHYEQTVHRLPMPVKRDRFVVENGEPGWERIAHWPERNVCGHCRNGLTNPDLEPGKRWLYTLLVQTWKRPHRRSVVERYCRNRGRPLPPRGVGAYKRNKRNQSFLHEGVSA